jgi:hypothetical protein
MMMRRFALFLFSFSVLLAAPALADDQSEANRLFVEATALADDAQAAADPLAAAEDYAAALERLERIVADHPGSDLAVQLAAHGQVGTLSLPLLRANAALAAMRAGEGDGADEDQLLKLRSSLEDERARVTELLSENSALKSQIYALQQEQSAASNMALEERVAMLESQLADEQARADSLAAELAAAGGAAGAAESAAASDEQAAEPETETAAVSEGEADSQLTPEDITNAIKEALQVGTERVVDQVGQPDGFNADPAIHIPLPDSLAPVDQALSGVGMGALTDDLELRINRAAEAATPQAKELFFQAIADMTVDDINAVFRGSDDAATQYFRGKMSDPLREAMRPIVEQSLAEAGAVQAYDEMMAGYKQIPLVPDIKADLTEHTLNGAMDGLFHYLAVEETAIRNDATARTTELLQRAFAAQDG